MFLPPLRNNAESIDATLNFILDWDLPHFMKTQFDEDGQAAIGSVINLSGLALCAQATTCSEYIRDVWPLHGIQVLKVFELALQDTGHKAEGR